ncbi:FeoB-associated Cys-rich membrane protein [Ruminococcaceae bacterium OttesenSCG-928-A11]|nr:FeoB-associated Cys-rich membrane protein [Ruminococcaceae bacterium OttesenSCG-928-A11]
MNVPTLIVLLAVLGLAAFVVARQVRKKGSGCAGGCAGCRQACGSRQGSDAACPHCADGHHG